MNALPRLCFGWRPGNALRRPVMSVPGASGLSRSADGTFGTLAADFARDGNRGYLVVGEAASRIFACDRDGSAFLDLPTLAERHDPRQFATSLNRDFDIIVLPMAYEIAPERRLDAMVTLLEHVDRPVVTLGLGIVDGDISAERLDPSMLALLRWFNANAAIFGVRAGRTESWMHRNGFTRAVALGCPSMHLYPQAIRNLKPFEPSTKPPRVATGGYLLRDVERSAALCELLEGTDASYFMQDEIFSASLPANTTIIDDARGLLERNLIEQMLRAWADIRPPFARYFYFDGLDVWRQAMAAHDVFVGDRFHGGVVAIQLGLPTLMFTRDVRADELSTFYWIPRADLAAARHQGLEPLLREGLSEIAIRRFQDTFEERDAAFWDAMSTASLLPVMDRGQNTELIPAHPRTSAVPTLK